MTPADLASLFELESKLAETVSNGSEASLETHSIREQIEKLPKSAQPPLKESLEKLDKELAVLLSGDEDSGRNEPGLDDVAGETGSLYAQIGLADAAPTAAQQQAAAPAGDELSQVLQHWVRLKASSIPELNRQLRTVHLPELSLERKPETLPEGGDEE